MPAITQVAERHGLAVIEDCCQAHLATCAGRPVGSFGAAGGYSFYPTKNLGALGDGGALTTNDDRIAERARRLRNGGQSERYRHAEFGVNSRLDEIQAAILRQRLQGLREATSRRRDIAALYRSALEGIDVLTVPPEMDEGHVYHLFAVLAARSWQSAAASSRAWRGDARALPDSIAPTTRVRVRGSGRVPDRRSRL